MRILLTLSLLLVIPVVQAQTQQPKDSAIVSFQLTNFQQFPIKNAILVLDFMSAYMPSLKTDNNGKARIKVLEGETFKVKLILEEDTYEYENLFEIPEANGVYQYDINLQYELQTFILNNVEFDFNKATIRPSSYPELNQVVDMMKLSPELRIRINGHTDDIGSEDYNMNLSQKRADAVKSYLISKKIQSDRIETAGYGESKPIASNKSDEDRQKNRRIEIELIQNQ